ncbi:NUDIX hydrolase domain-like protein [Chytriomyces sp. MP71]|nr:NUDIX hydrolase domain-like protein [Chytriomyces sp. MP71]
MQAARQGRDKQVYSETGARIVVGVVPILPDGNIVLVTSGKNDYFVLPKGGAESDESLQESACREAYEEAGLRGVLREGFECKFPDEKLNDVTGLPKSEFTFFLMDVTSQEAEWPECKERHRQTFHPMQALAQLRNGSKKPLHLALEAYIQQNDK